VRVVETLVVRDEADIVEAQIAYHLNAGVDFVVATDHGSQDGTTEILESFAGQGYLHRIPGEGPMVQEVAWRTRMARLAATEYDADWVLAADADEFWVPRTGSIKDVLGAVPPRFGVVGGVICHFVPRPDDGSQFAERMTARLVQRAPVNDPVSPMRPSPKSAFRGDPEVRVLHAAYLIESPRLEQLPGWCPFDVFHFPCRSVAQWSRKTARRGHADSDKQLGQYVKGLRAQERGEIDDVYQALVVDDETLRRGIELGVLVVDTRLRDALGGGPSKRDAGSTNPTPDVFSVSDSSVVRLQRRVDDANARLHAIETRYRLGRVLKRRRREIPR